MATHSLQVLIKQTVVSAFCGQFCGSKVNLLSAFLKYKAQTSYETGDGGLSFRINLEQRKCNLQFFHDCLLYRALFSGFKFAISYMPAVTYANSNVDKFVINVNLRTLTKLSTPCNFEI